MHGDRPAFKKKSHAAACSHYQLVAGFTPSKYVHMNSFNKKVVGHDPVLEASPSPHARVLGPHERVDRVYVRSRERPSFTVEGGKDSHMERRIVRKRRYHKPTPILS